MKYQARDPFNPYDAIGTISSDMSEYEHATECSEKRDVLATPEEPRSLRFLAILAILGGLTLGLRLINLQIVEGTKSRVMADGNRIRSREILPARGEIKDRNGVILADNVASYSLEIYPAELPRKRADWETILTTIRDVTGVDITAAETQLREQGLLSMEPIRLAEQLPREQALVWQAKLTELPGVTISKTPQRKYATIAGIGHILGYVGQVSVDDHKTWPSLSLAADVGKSGLELTYETTLQGTPGQKRIEVDAKGRIERILAELPPIQGQNLILTIDSRLEQSLTSTLNTALAKFESPGAAAVVMDVRDGSILAMASLPDFDPNIFITESRSVERSALLTDDRRPLLNRVTNGSYPSGSTIKPVIAAAALGEGTINPKTTLDTSTGVIQIGEWRFPDWKIHGITDVRRAIAESNDIFFYALGGGYDNIPGLGVDRMKTWLERFGFGKKTGIDLPSETSGLVPNNAWKEEHFDESWYIGDSYHMAIGQGYFLATPLQITQAIAAIANGGTLYPPHLVQSTANTGVSLPAPVAADPNNTDHLTVIREGMRQTITDGTARSLNDLAVPIAGKTGTAQYGPIVDGKQKTHSWFTGFAPAENPEIAFTFMIEGSSDTAVPAAKEFLQKWIELRGVGQ